MKLYQTLWGLLPPLDPGASMTISDDSLNKLITQRFNDSVCPWYVHLKE